jgi:hypothetical protein
VVFFQTKSLRRLRRAKKNSQIRGTLIESRESFVRGSGAVIGRVFFKFVYFFYKMVLLFSKNLLV